MFKVTNSENRFQKRCTPNILPCRIHHDGPVDASPRYWAPETAKGQSPLGFLWHWVKRPTHSSVTDGKPEAYFRGRRLRGQELEVPQGYRGVIVKEAGKEKAGPHNIEQGEVEGEEWEEREEEQEEITLLNEVGSFDKLLIWNHESVVEGDDAFVKGLCEWMSLAEAVSQVSQICGRGYERYPC